MRRPIAILLALAVAMGAASIAVGAARTPRDIPEGRCEPVREWIDREPAGGPSRAGKMLYGFNVCAPATVFTEARPCRCRRPMAL